MRLFAPLLATLLLTGCQVAPGDGAPPPAAGALVAPEAFDRVDAPWVAALSSGCGFCAPGHDERWTLFVFEDARVALFHAEGDDAGATTFDRDQRARLLAEAQGRAQERPDRYVYTARLLDPALPERLREAWATSTTEAGCTDFGALYAVRHANGTLAHQQTTCLDEGDPLVAFSEPLWRVQAEMRTNATRQG